jgi:type I restriction enzyme, S subunit
MMIKIPHYESYKISKFPLIGKIPSHWETVQLKRILSRNDGGVWNELEKENGTKVFRSTEINSDGTWNKSIPISLDLNPKEIKKAEIYEGDLIVTKSSGSLDHIGKTAIATKVHVGTCYSNFMQRLRLKDSFPKFYYYFLNSSLAREQYKLFTTSTTGLGNLNAEILGNIWVPHLSVNKQVEIVKFLDKKTAELDEAIAKKQRLIELLEERKAILINQAVTKGLNPDVPMKDSEVEWIGEIPEHWGVSTGRTILTEYQEINKGLKEDRVLSLSYGKIIIKPEEKMHGLMPESFETYQIVLPGDIIIRPTDLQNDKKSLRVGLVQDKGIITSAYICLRILGNNYPDYFYNQLHSFDVIKVFYGLGSGLRQNLSYSDFKYLPIVVPPKKEQLQISEFIEKIVREYLSAIEKQKEYIRKMEEYRGILISNAVTGKIKI